MVPQLWIWRFDHYLLSSYSLPVTSGDGDQVLAYGNKSYTNENWTYRHLPKLLEYQSASGQVQMALILIHQINQFGEHQAGKKYQSPLDLFEIGVVRVLADVGAYMRDDSPNALDIKKERSFLDDISDIRSELAMIDEILKDQKRILEDLINDSNENAKTDRHWPKVVRALLKIEFYRDRVTKIDRDAERVEKTVQDQLNLKRTYATMQDTRTGILLSTAVIGFTVVTIIFAPLSFMTGLFALPLSNLSDHLHNRTFETSGEKQVYSQNYVGGWFSKYLIFLQSSLGALYPPGTPA
jgi:hypothetical protein